MTLTVLPLAAKQISLSSSTIGVTLAESRVGYFLPKINDLLIISI